MGRKMKNQKKRPMSSHGAMVNRNVGSRCVDGFILSLEGAMPQLSISWWTSCQSTMPRMTASTRYFLRFCSALAVSSPNLPDSMSWLTRSSSSSPLISTWSWP